MARCARAVRIAAVGVAAGLCLGCAGWGRTWRCDAEGTLAKDPTACDYSWSRTTRGIGAGLLRGSAEAEALEGCEALAVSLMHDAPPGCYTGVTSPCAPTGCTTFRRAVPWH